MSIWAIFFGWPNGGVWSNLIASGICLAIGSVAALAGLRNLKATLERHHAERLAQDRALAGEASTHREKLHRALLEHLQGRTAR